MKEDEQAGGVDAGGAAPAGGDADIVGVSQRDADSAARSAREEVALEVGDGEVGCAGERQRRVVVEHRRGDGDGVEAGAAGAGDVSRGDAGGDGDGVVDEVVGGDDGQRVGQARGVEVALEAGDGDVVGAGHGQSVI